MRLIANLARVAAPAAVIAVALAGGSGCAQVVGLDDEPRVGEWSVPAIDGDYLLAIDGTGTPSLGGGIFQFHAVVAYSPETRLMELTIADLDADTRAPVGRAEVLDGLEIENAQTLPFQAGFDIEIAAEANPAATGTIVLDADLAGVIIGADRFCGELAGSVVAPTAGALQDARFAAIRIDSLEWGSLPPPETECF